MFGFYKKWGIHEIDAQLLVSQKGSHYMEMTSQIFTKQRQKTWKFVSRGTAR